MRRDHIGFSKSKGKGIYVDAKLRQRLIKQANRNHMSLAHVIRQILLYGVLILESEDEQEDRNVRNAE